MVSPLLLVLLEGAVMTAQPPTTGDRHAAYALHTLSCRTCWVDKTQCPTARELDPWQQEARR